MAIEGKQDSRRQRERQTLTQRQRQRERVSGLDILFTGGGYALL
jgi:hypothetical protein